MVKGVINYIADSRGDGVVPFQFDTDWSGAERVPTNVDIANARPMAGDLSLDREGFMLERLASGVTDYRNPEQVNALWIPAVKNLVKRVTGAQWVVTWALNTRFSNRDPQSRSTPVAAPARACHSDLYGDFDPARIGKEPLSEDAAAEMACRMGGRSPKRWRVINVWQQISPPPQDSPLALCDARTVTAADLLDGQAPDGTEEGRIHHLALYKANPVHRWYYFSDMLPGECLLFSCFDPEAQHFHGRVPHIAFDLPDCPPNVVPRSSIEIRALAVLQE